MSPRFVLPESLGLGVGVVFGQYTLSEVVDVNPNGLGEPLAFAALKRNCDADSRVTDAADKLASVRYALEGALRGLPEIDRPPAPAVAAPFNSLFGEAA